MKNLLILLLLGVSYTSIQAQMKDKISLEGCYGLSIPINFVSTKSNANFNSTSHLGGGIRYMFNQNIGIKGELSYDKFSANNTDLGMNSTGINTQIYYNLGKLVGLVYVTNETLGLFVHSGFGLVINKSLNNINSDRAGVYCIGLTPLFKLSHQFALSSDFSYKMGFKQNLCFDGTFSPNSTLVNNNLSTFTITLGAIYYLGDSKYHADWSR